MRTVYVETSLYMGLVRVEDDEAVVYLNSYLKNLPKGLHDAIYEHEKVHAMHRDFLLNQDEGQVTGRPFLFVDGIERMNHDQRRVHLKNILKQNEANELLEELEECDYDRQDHCYACGIMRCEIAKKGSAAIRQLVDLVAYANAKDEETKSWIAAMEHVREEIYQGMKEWYRDSDREKSE